jgi:hypothetical protein
MNKADLPVDANLLELFNSGEKVDSWACDCEPHTGELQSNGGQEVVIRGDDGKKHLFVCDWDGKPVLYEGLYEQNVVDYSDKASLLVYVEGLEKRIAEKDKSEQVLMLQIGQLNEQLEKSQARIYELEEESSMAEKLRLGMQEVINEQKENQRVMDEYVGTIPGITAQMPNVTWYAISAKGGKPAVNQFILVAYKGIGGQRVVTPGYYNGQDYVGYNGLTIIDKAYAWAYTPAAPEEE